MNPTELPEGIEERLIYVWRCPDFPGCGTTMLDGSPEEENHSPFSEDGPICLDCNQLMHRVAFAAYSDLPAIREQAVEEAKAEWLDGLEERMPDWLLAGIREQAVAEEREVVGGECEEAKREARESIMRLLSDRNKRADALACHLEQPANGPVRPARNEKLDGEIAAFEVALAALDVSKEEGEADHG
jgi:hypothetical protein